MAEIMDAACWIFDYVPSHLLVDNFSYLVWVRSLFCGIYLDFVAVKFVCPFFVAKAFGLNKKM